MQQGKIFGKYADRTIRFLYPLLGLNNRKPIEKKSIVPKRVFIMKFPHIGDTVLLTPTLKALKRAYPNAYISMASWKANEFILRNNPYIDELVPFHSLNQLMNPFKLLRLVKLLQKKQFDTFLDFGQFAQITPILAYLAGIKNRIGLAPLGHPREKALTKPVDYVMAKHEVECFLDIVRGLTGESMSASSPKLFLSEECKDFAQAFMYEKGVSRKDLVIGIHPGAQWPAKRWNIEKFSQLTNEISKRYGAKIVLFAGPKEEFLVHKFDVNSPEIIMATGYSQEKTAAILEKIDLFITNDSGFMHVAAALETPVIAIFGPSDPVKWGPYGKQHIVIREDISCSPCNILGAMRKCDDFKCMKLIKVGSVLKAAEKKIQELSQFSVI